MQQQDVIVVGAGPGGMAAAVAAADAGARVIVLEALDGIGGNAVWSTGYLAFTGFDMQEEAGLGDSVERFLEDARREVELQRERYGIVWDEALTRAYIEGSAETYRFLRRYGVTFNRFIERPIQHTVHRMIDLTDTWSLQRAYLQAFEERGIEVRYRTRARRLLMDGGRVSGVIAESADGSTEQLDAGRGVVLATGGYQAGVEVRRRYQPEHLATTPYLGVPTCRGDGHVMGQAVGGDLINMTMVQPLVIVASALVEDSIAVNSSGERFHDEAGPYDDRCLRARPSARTVRPLRVRRAHGGPPRRARRPDARTRRERTDPRRAGRADRGPGRSTPGDRRALERDRGLGCRPGPRPRPRRAAVGPNRHRRGAVPRRPHGRRRQLPAAGSGSRTGWPSSTSSASPCRAVGRG